MLLVGICVTNISIGMVGFFFKFKFSFVFIDVFFVTLTSFNTILLVFPSMWSVQTAICGNTRTPKHPDWHVWVPNPDFVRMTLVSSRDSVKCKWPRDSSLPGGLLLFSRISGVLSFRKSLFLEEIFLRFSFRILFLTPFPSYPYHFYTQYSLRWGFFFPVRRSLLR